MFVGMLEMFLKMLGMLLPGDIKPLISCILIKHDTPHNLAGNNANLAYMRV